MVSSQFGQNNSHGWSHVRQECGQEFEPFYLLCLSSFQRHVQCAQIAWSPCLPSQLRRACPFIFWIKFVVTHSKGRKACMHLQHCALFRHQWRRLTPPSMASSIWLVAVSGVSKKATQTVARQVALLWRPSISIVVSLVVSDELTKSSRIFSSWLLKQLTSNRSSRLFRYWIHSY